MTEIFINSAGYLGVILIGYVMRLLSPGSKNLSGLMTQCIFLITLPCALISAYAPFEMSWILAIAMLAGIAANLTTLLIGYLISGSLKPIARANTMLSMSGYNTLIFGMPFFKTFFTADVLAFAVFFELGNCFMSLGGNYALAGLVFHNNNNLDFKGILGRLFSSVPFDVLILIVILAAMHVSVPESVLQLTNAGAQVNTYLFMLVIGLNLEISLNTAQISSVLRIFFFRCTINVVLALAIFYVFPLDLDVRQILILCLMCPISMMAPLFSLKMHSKSPVPALVNVLSMILSLICMPLLYLIFTL